MKHYFKMISCVGATLVLMSIIFMTYFRFVFVLHNAS